MSAREIKDHTEELEIRLYRIKGKKKFVIVRYSFENPRVIAEIISFLNSKSVNPILEKYIEWVEKLAAEQEAREDCIERLGERRIV